MIFYPKNIEELNLPIQFLKDKLISLPSAIVLFSGEMGSGKTTFIRNLVHSYNPSISVNSPTYNLIHEYQVSDSITFYHFDLFRIKRSEDLENLGFEEIWGVQGISLIEWGDIGRDLYPITPIQVFLEYGKQTERKIEIIEDNSK